MSELDTATDIGSICASWRAQALAADDGAARLSRAKLRRADGPVAALGVRAVHDLNGRLAAAGHDMRRGERPDRLALIATALAHLKDGNGPHVAQAFGAGDPAALSGIRFNALVRAATPRELWKPLVRGLAVIEGRANAAQLATDILYWGDRVRTRWCFEYYGEGFAAPSPEHNIEEATE
ncbi:type I-E CRISPR-associated protein Cse2/CasB [Roseovarius salinarum]|uniref:type I-E CRISPR-associated protein Cse2/CasB n=1 Tax=Roseovarius salinarum TaxID=1981892 RepID=UPI000C343C3C|nr:type I-E CRISPR-associated protein Cse2/CasB [Roseovarius salinarum]